MTTDTVDLIAGVTPALEALRRRRPATREQLQASFDALFRPVSAEHVSHAERKLVAAFATALTAAGDSAASGASAAGDSAASGDSAAGDPASGDPTAAFYADRAREADPVRTAAVLAEAEAAATPGPFGAYRELGLHDESTDGPRYTPGDAATAVLGERLAAALAHTHLLVLRPREASGADLGRLLDAGWSPDGIVTLSQLVSFLSFQQRVISGLRVLEAAGLAAEPAGARDAEGVAA